MHAPVSAAEKEISAVTNDKKEPAQRVQHGVPGYWARMRNRRVTHLRLSRMQGTAATFCQVRSRICVGMRC